MDQNADPDTRMRELLNERIERLEAFSEMVKLVVVDLKAQMKQADR